MLYYGFGASPRLRTRDITMAATGNGIVMRAARVLLGIVMPGIAEYMPKQVGTVAHTMIGTITSLVAHIVII